MAAVAAALAWLFRQAVRGEFRWRRSPADWLLPAGLALLLLQVVPLGEDLLARLSPDTPRILPLWTRLAEPSAAMGLWACISMTPPVTREAFLLFIAYSLVVLVAVQRFKYLEDIERMLHWIALSAVGMAILGILQWTEGNGLYLWFYRHPYSDASALVTGSFSNRNHFAQFLALGIGPLLAWLAAAALAHRKHPAARHGRGQAFDPAAVRLVALGIVVFAAPMSLSRGGAVALAVAGSVGVAAGYRAGAMGAPRLVGAAVLAAVTVAALCIRGYNEVHTRLGDLASASPDKLDASHGRRTIWAADAKAVPNYLALGGGVGSHAEIYPMYLETPPAQEFTHAENSPLQLLLETGAVGLGLMLAALALVAFWCLGALRAAAVRLTAFGDVARGPGVAPHPALRGAVSASLAANAVHALVDFVWYVPACMVLVALQAAAAYRLWQLARDPSGRRFRTVPMPRAAALAAVLLLAIGAVWVTIHSVGLVMAQSHWEAYLLRDIAAAKPDKDKDKTKSPAPAERDQVATAALVLQIAELEEALNWNSDLPRAHLRLADAYLAYFDLHQMSSTNAIPLAQLRAAAIAGGFTSPEAVSQWLARAVGDRRGDLERARQQRRPLWPSRPWRATVISSWPN